MHNLTWTGTATALSSISHGSQTRGLVTLLRRETIIGPSPDYRPYTIPLVSGNAFRGKLRRHAEQLLAEALGYRGRLTIAAAAALRSGGALVKTTREPISGSRLARLRALVPLIGVFGAAGAGRIIDGCLQVGKLMPLCVETAHLLEHTLPVTVDDLTQIETFSRTDDSGSHDAATDELTTTQLQYRCETFRAGTQFDTWINLTNPTPTEASFFNEVIDTFTPAAAVAGRAGTGHGRLRLNLTTTATTSPPQEWRSTVIPQADEAIDLLNEL